MNTRIITLKGAAKREFLSGTPSTAKFSAVRKAAIKHNAKTGQRVEIAYASVLLYVADNIKRDDVGSWLADLALRLAA